MLAEARRQADLSIGAIEAEVAELRGALARETLTEARVEGATRRLEARRAAIPQAGPPPPIGTPSMRIWQVGDRAVAPGGWDGILGAIDTERGRGSLEVGGMRVDVDLGTLRAAGEVPPAEVATPAPTTRPRTGRRGEFGPEPTTSGARSPAPGRRAGRSTATAPRAVASSLDLRGARVEEALELLDAYLDRCRPRGGRSRDVRSTATAPVRCATRCARCSTAIRRCGSGAPETEAKAVTAPRS